jgi:hypothetical protein
MVLDPPCCHHHVTSTAACRADRCWCDCSDHCEPVLQLGHQELRPLVAMLAERPPDPVPAGGSPWLPVASGDLVCSG